MPHEDWASPQSLDTASKMYQLPFLALRASGTVWHGSHLYDRILLYGLLFLHLHLPPPKSNHRTAFPVALLEKSLQPMLCTQPFLNVFQRSASCHEPTAPWEPSKEGSKKRQPQAQCPSSASLTNALRSSTEISWNEQSFLQPSTSLVYCSPTMKLMVLFLPSILCSISLLGILWLQ